MIDIFTRHGVCMHCELPIHADGRAPIHTDSNHYRCSWGGTFAEFLSSDTAEEMLRKGYEEAANDYEDQIEESYNNGWDEGRKDLRRELIHWLESHQKETGVIDQLLDRLYE